MSNVVAQFHKGVYVNKPIQVGTTLAKDIILEDGDSVDDKFSRLACNSNGELAFEGKNLVRSVNGVNADASGNVTINAGFATPDYSASVSQAINTDYTAPSDGFIYGELSSHGDGSAYYILIDNTYVIGTQNTTHAKYSDTYVIFMVPIKKGTKYRFVVTVSETERPSAVNFAPLLK